MSPLAVARYTPKTLSHFLLNTRGLSRLQTLLSPPQKGRRKLQGFLRKEMLYFVGRGFISRRIQRETNLLSVIWGWGPIRHTVLLI